MSGRPLQAAAARGWRVLGADGGEGDESERDRGGRREDPQIADAERHRHGAPG